MRGFQFRRWRVSGGQNHHAGLNSGDSRASGRHGADRGAARAGGISGGSAEEGLRGRRRTWGAEDLWRICGGGSAGEGLRSRRAWGTEDMRSRICGAGGCGARGELSNVCCCQWRKRKQLVRRCLHPRSGPAHPRIALPGRWVSPHDFPHVGGGRGWEKCRGAGPVGITL